MDGLDREEEEAFEELLHPTKTEEAPASDPDPAAADDDDWLLDA